MWSSELAVLMDDDRALNPDAIGQSAPITAVRHELV